MKRNDDSRFDELYQKMMGDQKYLDKYSNIGLNGEECVPKNMTANEIFDAAFELDEFADAAISDFETDTQAQSNIRAHKAGKIKLPSIVANGCKRAEFEDVTDDEIMENAMEAASGGAKLKSVSALIMQPKGKKNVSNGTLYAGVNYYL